MDVLKLLRLLQVLRLDIQDLLPVLQELGEFRTSECVVLAREVGHFVLWVQIEETVRVTPAVLLAIFQPVLWKLAPD